MELAQMVVYWAVTVFSIASIVVGSRSMIAAEKVAASGIRVVDWAEPTLFRQGMLVLLWLAGYVLLWVYDLVPGIVVVAMFAYIAWLIYKAEQITKIQVEAAIEKTSARLQQYEHLVNPH